MTSKDLTVVGSQEPTKPVWTHFYDMHSGGRAKETRDGFDLAHIYIEAPSDEAKIIFWRRFGHSPERTTCSCCGEDYSISQLDGTPEQDMAQRAEWMSSYKDMPLVYEGDGVKLGRVQGRRNEAALAVRAAEIKPEERVGELPQSGWVWVD